MISARDGGRTAERGISAGMGGGTNAGAGERGVFRELLSEVVPERSSKIGESGWYGTSGGGLGIKCTGAGATTGTAGARDGAAGGARRKGATLGTNAGKSETVSWK